VARPTADAGRSRTSARLEIRQATRADLEIVVQLRLALLREHREHAVYGRLRPDAAERARVLYATQLESRGEAILLAERHGETVGILRCVESHGSPLLRPSRYGYVSSVYVIPAARRRGVLRALLAAADDWCRARGLDEMRLHNATDSVVANATWGALGFAPVETLRVRAVPEA
jgi:ribosomal protein S18 acetylase RimI-like enzyme